MIGSTVRIRSAPLWRKFVRVAMSAKARPSTVDPMPTSDGEEERVPGDAAAQAAREAVEPPDRGLGELVEERRRGEAAGLILEGAGEDRRHREEHEDRDQRHDEGDRGDDEDVAAAPGPRREPVAEQHQEGEPDERRAETHAALARPRRAEEIGEPGRAPAAMPDGEALDDEPDEAEKAGQDEPPRRRRAAGADEERQRREAERNEERQEPRGAPGEPEPKPAPGLTERIAGKTGDEIPGQDRIAGPGKRQPDARGPAHSLSSRPELQSSGEPGSSSPRQCHGSRIDLRSRDDKRAERDQDRTLFRRALDLGVPFREQAAALFGGAVFGEIEVDELDLAELRRVG